MGKEETGTLAEMPKLPTIPGANMMQLPVLIPGMPAPPPIPLLPGMEKVPPPPGVKVVDEKGKVVATGPALPKPPAIPGLPGVAAPPIPPEVPKEKLSEEEIEAKLAEEEATLAPSGIEEEILEETEGVVEAPPSAAEVLGTELEEGVEEVETRIEEAELSGEELVV